MMPNNSQTVSCHSNLWSHTPEAASQDTSHNYSSFTSWYESLSRHLADPEAAPISQFAMMEAALSRLKQAQGKGRKCCTICSLLSRCCSRLSQKVWWCKGEIWLQISWSSLTYLLPILASMESNSPSQSFVLRTQTSSRKRNSIVFTKGQYNWRSRFWTC